jgi:lysozyme family protein
VVQLASLFSQAFAFTLQAEGGYVLTQSANDKGGATMAGLSSKTLASYYGRTLSPAEMKALLPSDIATIYTRLFWLPLGFDNADDLGLCTAVFDAAVLTGVAHSVMMLQSCIGAKADGKMGPLSLSAMRSSDMPTVRLAFAQAFLAYLDGIVRHDPTQQKWALGWYTRAIKPLATFF